MVVEAPCPAPDYQGLLETVAARAGERDEARVGLNAYRERLATLGGERTKVAAQVEKLVEAERNDAARRLLDGEETAPPDVRRRRTLRKLQEQQAAIEAAAPMIYERITAGEALFQCRESALVDATLALGNSLRNGAVNEARETISRLAPMLARLTAADLIQDRLIGGRFALRPEQATDLFSGARVAATFIAKLPDRLRPPALTPADVNHAAEIIAAETLTPIKGH